MELDPDSAEHKEYGEVIDKCLYFFGLMMRDDAEDLLIKDGDFLVRSTYRAEHEEIILSARWSEEYVHIVLSVGYNGYFTLSRLRFETVQDLIQHYWHRSDVVPTAKYGIALPAALQLIRPISWQKWNLKPEWITTGKKLAQGNFGSVWLAKYQRPEDEEPLQVAVKICDTISKARAKFHFLRAARIQRELEHPNVCRCLGVQTIQEPLQLVTELADHNSLEAFLKSHKSLAVVHKLKLCIDAARALDYLTEKNILHLDVAARNCLVSTDQDPKAAFNRRLLLSDFGLSQRGPVYLLQAGDHIPTRWSAPELLNAEGGGPRVATIKSDVWSLGVLIWEMFSDCQKPYAMVPSETQLLAYLSLGNRLEPPPQMPPAVVELMNMCFKLELKERPSSPRILANLEAAVLASK